MANRQELHQHTFVHFSSPTCLLGYVYLSCAYLLLQKFKPVAHVSCKVYSLQAQISDLPERLNGFTCIFNNKFHNAIVLCSLILSSFFVWFSFEFPHFHTVTLACHRSTIHLHLICFPPFLSIGFAQHPWTEPDTVPIWTLFVFGYFVLATIVGISEYIFARRIRNVSQKRSLLTALRFALGLWTSTMLATMLVENGKNFVGRLRPSFAERCLGRGAVPPTQASDLLRVITEDSECIAGGAWEGRRSFPSGHASLSVGMGVYFQMWTMRVAARGACHGGLKALSIYVLGIIIFAWGLWVAASRVVDNAHHVSDVAVGAAIGGWLAAVHFQMVANETDRLEMQERDLQASGIDDHHHHHHHHHAG